MEVEARIQEKKQQRAISRQQKARLTRVHRGYKVMLPHAGNSSIYPMYIGILPGKWPSSGTLPGVLF